MLEQLHSLRDEALAEIQAAPDADGVVSQVGFVGLFGAGCEVYLSKQLALTFDATYALATGSISGLSYTAIGAVGLQWRFSPK